MEIDEYLKLVRKRRSVRKFKPDPIPDEYVEKILEAARWAMSGANGQPWEFIVIKDQATKDKMAEAYYENRQRTYNIEKTRVEELMQPMFRVPLTGPPSFQHAPVVIVVLGDERTHQATVLSVHFLPPGEGRVINATYIKNMANATQNIHMAAAALGLGSQWFSVAGLFERALQRILDVPDEISIHTMVPIGYPAYKPPPPYRRKPEEIVHYEKYDHSKYRTDDDIYNFIVDLRRRTREAYDIPLGRA
jgi:nitroreductase